MLSRLYVKNVALISEADIEFDRGLNVLSGETGSGKSVILDSVNFVLGCKADRTMIRHGENEAIVKAEFNVDSDCAAVKKLAEFDIECDGDIIISRKLNIDGKGSIKINGNSVSATMLKDVTAHLVDVHGQSEHFFLLNEENQLNVIDGLIGESAKNIKDNLAALIAQKREFKSKISELGGDEAERARRLDLLNFQINEIDSADIKVGEFDELKARQNIILNSEKILFAINAVRSILNDDNGISDGLTAAAREMSRISDIEPEYAKIYSRLESLYAETSDIAELLGDYADNLNFDAEEAEQIDERLTIIKALKKKYGFDEEEILSFRDKAKSEYEIISEGAAAIEKYLKNISDCDDKIYALYTQLTDLRKRAADKFCTSVVSELKTLNIPDARFTVKFAEYNKESVNLLSADGCDKISFEFSANKGEPLKSLNKVISGGELSRFMLAVKTIIKNINGISTYIFDEIDAGISGFTAATVAKKFKAIARDTQILAVSHLPQVSAASNAQFLIFKKEEDGKTYTKVKKLEKEEKIEEIMRLSGSVGTTVARQHAIELIEQFSD